MFLIVSLCISFCFCFLQAGTDNNYPGIVIGEVMQTQWNSYCPNVNLTCSQNGELVISMVRWYIYWTFYLDIEYDELTDAIRAKIITAIAYAANCHESLVSIYQEEVGDGGKRRLADSLARGVTVTTLITTETEDDATKMTQFLESSADDDVWSQTGYNSTGGTSEVQDTPENVNGVSTTGLCLATLTSLLMLLCSLFLL